MRRSYRNSQQPALTAHLGAAIAKLHGRDLPAQACAIVRRGLVDCIGVMIAGSTEPAVERVRSVLGPPWSGEARLFPDGVRCSARDAALVNGMAAHVHDFDDVALDGHPSAVLVPALLAEAEAIGAKGADVIRGYVAGYETWATLWKASAGPLHARGWHPSGVFGVVAAAAACAALRRLTPDETTSALGLAAAQAAGLIANFGTMAKSFQVGHAAEAGLFSARLALGGVNASHEALEHKHGFLNAYAGAHSDGGGGFGDPDWAILEQGLDIKVYPVCYAAHRLIEGALQLAKEFALTPPSIDSIELRLGRIQSDLLHSHRPRTVLEAKFSAEFAVAAALVAQAVGLNELREGFVLSDDVQHLIVRTVRMIDPELGEPPFSPFDQVKVRLSDGRVLEGSHVKHASGSRYAPPSKAESWEKFKGSAGYHLPVGSTRQLFEALWDLNPSRSITELLDDTGLRTAA
jgi:2-methylcitrate dehydratase PrpD